MDGGDHGMLDDHFDGVEESDGRSFYGSCAGAIINAIVAGWLAVPILSGSYAARGSAARRAAAVLRTR
ncbi:hypothetical protein [Mariniluteicoccus flavus]